MTLQDKKRMCGGVFNPQPNPTLKFLDGSVVPLVDTQRFLGVLFDSSLSFDGHIAEARAKFRRRLFIVRSLKDRSWGASRHLMVRGEG